MEMIILDGSILEERESAHSYLWEMLALPEYYGKNLDALYDCLTELQNIEVQIAVNEEKGPYLQKVLGVFREAAEENARIKVKICEKKNCDF